MAERVREVLPCPYCGDRPEIDRCIGWPRDLGPAPWYIGCYRGGDGEHFIGVNADTQAEARAEWNRAVLQSSGGK